MVTVRNQTYNRTYRTLKGKQREQVHLCISVAERLWEKLRTKLDKMTSFSRGGVVSHCLYILRENAQNEAHSLHSHSVVGSTMSRRIPDWGTC